MCNILIFLKQAKNLVRSRLLTPSNKSVLVSANLGIFLMAFLLVVTMSSISLANTLITISGHILDQNGSSIRGANIILQSQLNGLDQNVVSDGEGVFYFKNLPEGSYKLIVTAQDFVPIIKNISLPLSDSQQLELTLFAINSKKVAESPANSVTEVEQLRQQLAQTTQQLNQTNQQVEKLAILVQELQAKINKPENKTDIASVSNDLPVNTTSPTNNISSVVNNNEPVKKRSILAGLIHANKTQNDGQSGQSPQSEDPNSIDKLIKPKSEGGQFSGSQGLFKTDRVKVGGYLGFRYQTRGLDDGIDIQSSVDEENAGMTATTNFKRSGFVNSRLVLGIAATLAPKLLFNSEIEYEFAGKETEIEQAYVEYQFHPTFNFRGGVITPPLGRFNIFHDDNLQDIATRPLVSTFVIPSTYKDAGVGFLGSFNIGKRSKLSYEGYVVNGLRSDEGGEFAREAGLFESKGNNRFFDNNPQKSVVGRLVFSPVIGLELGASGYRGKHDNQGQYDLSIFSYDWKFTRGNFQVIGEYARAAIERAPETDEELAAKAFLQSLPKGNYTNTFEFIDANINEPIFDKSARSTDGLYLEARYRFRPRWFTSRTTEEGSIAPVFRFDQVNFDRSYKGFSFPLNQRRYSMGLSIRPAEATTFNFTYNFNRKPDLFLRLPDGRPFSPYFTNLGVNSFSFGMAVAF